MARRKTGDKLTDIRLATVAEVVEVGSSAASINAIAKRAGLAVGTLYRYHANKDALLRAVYLAVKTDMYETIMQAANAEQSARSRIRAMWFSILDYALKHPNDFIFAEVIMNAAVLSPEETQQVAAMSADMSREVEAGVADDTLRPLNIQAINTLLVAPALLLGRQSAMSGQPLDMEHAEDVFTLCWKAVAN